MCGNLSSSSIKGTATGYIGVLESTNKSKSLSCSNHLVVGFGFSGHGFKLSPAVGRVLAQQALGLPTDVSLLPYSLERFRTGRLLTGRYGMGAVA
jgi:glycine/D-amino acid oxidase-like deaminating enzyme